MNNEKKKNTITQRITSKQKKFLDTYKNPRATITHACEIAGISRQTYYNWIESNPRFKEESDMCRERQIDAVEDKLMARISDDDTTAIIFFLKTIGKQRGYVERVENDIPQLNPFLQLMMEASKEEEK